MTINLILGVILLGGIGFSLWSWHRNRKRERLNNHIADELDRILVSMQEVVKKKQTSSSRVGIGADYDLGDPQMLSTLITVIINKYGSLRLGLSDFIAIADGEYVSVYVDTTTNDVILSLDHSMGPKDPSNLIGLKVDTDDNTFH